MSSNSNPSEQDEGTNAATSLSPGPGPAQAENGVQSESPSRASFGDRKLGLSHVIAQSLATNAPIFNAITFLPLIVGGTTGNGAGSAVPLSVLFSAVTMFGVMWTLSRFSRYLDTTGSVYVFISRSFGDRTGTAFGSLNYLSIVLGPLTPLIFGGYLQGYLSSQFGIHISWWILSLGLIAVSALILALGVGISTRIQLVWMLVAMLAITAFSVVVIIRSISGGVDALAPFNVHSSPHGWLGVAWGMLYGLFIFAGVESAQNLAEETPNPKRSIPRALMIVVGLLTVYFMLVAYATVLGFHLDGDAIAKDAAPLLALAAPGHYGATWLVDVLTVMLLFDMFTLTLGTCVYGSRGLFALARDGRLPHALTRVSGKRHVPTVATATPVVWMVALVLGTAVAGSLFVKTGSPAYLTVFTWIGGIQGLITAVIYGTVCLSAFGWLRRKDSHAAYLVVAAGVGVLSACGILFSNLYHASASMYVNILIVAGFLLFSFVQSTIRRRRGQFGASAASLEELEEI
ncbi:APC family permease [Flexivirga caeni]|uniref:APC family permease n=1 Tax=Flexivirga caeni TaxID=2294115 RepID=UPI0013157CE4|nr:APC family permease [Flexivirga caeni]